MYSPPQSAHHPTGLQAQAASNVHASGDGSCPSTAGRDGTPSETSGSGDLLLVRSGPEAYRRWWTDTIAQQKKLFESTDSSAFVFSLGNDVLALPTSAIHEVMPKRHLHSLPHRRDGLLLGLANCHGELLTCISLPALLGLNQEPDDNAVQDHRRKSSNQLLVVMNWRGSRLGFPVDQALGTFRFRMASLRQAPPAVEAGPGCPLGLLEWEGRLVTFLDVDRLMASLSQVLR
jgi:chemotaxis-related protein WspD